MPPCDSSHVIRALLQTALTVLDQPEQETALQLDGRTVAADIPAHAEPAPDTDRLERRIKLAHQQRRTKEAQLDGIRRALIDTGVIDEDDPYSHADLEDVIRRTVPEIERQAVGWERKYFEMVEKRTASAAALNQIRELAERWKYTGDRKEGPLRELLTALGEDQR